MERSSTSAGRRLNAPSLLGQPKWSTALGVAVVVSVILLGVALAVRGIDLGFDMTDMEGRLGL
jgi:hypothetical protein